MLALIRKEINTFFASAIGYLVIAIFLLINGLFLWVFRGPYNILNSGFADLSPFFQLAPWILLFLVPATTMRSFAEERKSGTLELLLTSSLKKREIVLGKFLGNFILIGIALLPSILYFITLYQLGNPVGNIDAASVFGSYIALFLLSASYTAIGIFSSSITQNQIIAFLIAALLSFLFYLGWNSLAEFDPSGVSGLFFEQLGMQFHYERISRGVIDTRDVVYFLLVLIVFLVMTAITLQKKTIVQKMKSIALSCIIGVIVVAIGNTYYKRFDLTHDQRFTLSEATKKLVRDIKVPIAIDVLLEGDFPSEFRRLQTETKQLLEEFNALNPKVKYIFIDPLKEEEIREETLQQLQQHGLTPMQVTVKESGKTETETVVPWAIVNYQDKSVRIPLVKHTIGASTEERVSNSIQQLEYAFADGLTKLLRSNKQKIALLKGNGQLHGLKIADFVRNLQKHYHLNSFPLDSANGNPLKTLEDLQNFDLIINTKPTQTFSENEKYVLDQYLMHEGKAIWMVEPVDMEIDSLLTPSGSALATIRDLQLNDLLFSYGVRINPVLVNDLISSPLVLASGEGNNTQFNTFPWFYNPLAKTKSEHPVIKNIEAVQFEFANQIDTLKNDIKKTILLQSSEKTKLEGVPKQISLDIIQKKPDLTSYNQGKQNLAVLLEGSFKSNYKNRVKPVKNEAHKDHGAPSKMIVIADGDIAKNYVRKNRPMELGYDPILNLQYGNKEFLMNAVNYLMDDSGLISVRSKKINIPFLEIEKVVRQKSTWQAINIIMPLLCLVLFGVAFIFLRKRKYKKPL